MIAVIISVTALFISLALLISGSAMLSTLISLRLSLDGVADVTIGMVLACYSVGFVFGAMWGGSVIRRVGHIRAYAVFAAIACSVALLHPVIVSPESWAIMRFLVGFCLAGLLTVTESWINDRATNETRGKILGVYTINFYMASSIGQFLLGLGDPQEFVLFSVVAILIALSLVPLSLTRSLVPTAPSHTERLKLRRLVYMAPAGMTGVLVSGISLGAFLTMAPLYVVRSGMDVSELAGYMSFTIACSVLLQWPAGWLSDRIGRLPVLVGLLLTGALAAALVALLGSQSSILLFAGSGIFFAVATSAYPVGVALTNDQLPNDQLMAACASLLRTYGIGTMAGPLLASWLMGLLDASALFVFISLSLLVGALMVNYVFRHADTVPLEAQGDYAPVVPVSSPVIVELDPRNEDFEQHHEGAPAAWDISDRIEMLVMDVEPEHSADKPSDATRPSDREIASDIAAPGDDNGPRQS